MESRSEKDKMLAGELYQAFGEELFGERQAAKRRCREFNATTEEQMAERDAILRKLLGSCGANAFVEPSFRCDYGYNIHVGENFYANYDLIILDCCEVRIGNNCMIAPRVSIFTATHPLDAADVFEIATTTRDATGFKLRWLARESVNYRVTCTADLTTWVELPNSRVIGAGIEVEYTDPAVTAPGKFYRVEVLQP